MCGSVIAKNGNSVIIKSGRFRPSHLGVVIHCLQSKQRRSLRTETEHIIKLAIIRKVVEIERRAVLSRCPWRTFMDTESYQQYTASGDLPDDEQFKMNTENDKLISRAK